MAAQSTALDAKSDPTAATDLDALTAHELYRHTLYKSRYSLEAAGFTSAEVAHLLFVKWLHSTRRVSP